MLPSRTTTSARGGSGEALSPSLIYRSPRLYETAIRVLYGRSYDARYRALAALIPDNSAVVELCCGPGALYTRYLRSKVAQYVGLDLNPIFIEHIRRHGGDGHLWDVRSDRPLPGAQYVIMQASLYQFLPDSAEAVVGRMIDAATEEVIVAEPIRNLTAGRSTFAGILAWLADPGTGPQPHRFTEATLDRFFEGHATRIRGAFLLPGGREKAYRLAAGEPSRVDLRD